MFKESNAVRSRPPVENQSAPLPARRDWDARRGESWSGLAGASECPTAPQGGKRPGKFRSREAENTLDDSYLWPFINRGVEVAALLIITDRLGRINRCAKLRAVSAR